MALLDHVKDLALERLRLALALLALALFCLLFSFVGLNAPEGWAPVFAALAACYFTAFGALVVEAFWARWFASGLAWSGTMLGIASLVLGGWQPALVLYAGLHGLIVVGLMGRKLATRYEGQSAWRQRYGMDDYGVAKLRKTVTRAAASLPGLIMFALGPRDAALTSVLALLPLGLAVAGVWGLVRGRAWGWLGLAGAALSLGAANGLGLTMVASGRLGLSAPVTSVYLLATSVFVALAVAPLGPAAWRLLRAGR
jgi:hypothetical protein